MIGLVASYQPQLKRIPCLQQFQLWELVVTGHTAVITCKDDSDSTPAVRQEIEHTDFPEPGVKLYVEGGVLLLPSEH